MLWCVLLLGGVAFVCGSDEDDKLANKIILPQETAPAGAPDIYEYFTRSHTLPGEDVREPIEAYEGMIGNVDTTISGTDTSALMNSNGLASSGPYPKHDPGMLPSENPLKSFMPDNQNEDCSKQTKGLDAVQDAKALASSKAEQKSELLRRIEEMERQLAKVDGPRSPLLIPELRGQVVMGYGGTRGQMPEKSASAHPASIPDQSPPLTAASHMSGMNRGDS